MIGCFCGSYSRVGVHAYGCPAGEVDPCERCVVLEEALDAAAWHLQTIASDIKNPAQRAIADKWIAEARAAIAKASVEESE